MALPDTATLDIIGIDGPLALKSANGKINTASLDYIGIDGPIAYYPVQEKVSIVFIV